LWLLLNLSLALSLLLDRDTMRAGGWVGGFLSTVLQDACGLVGASVIAAAGVLLAVMFTTGTSLRGSSSALVGHTRQRVGRWRESRTNGAALASAANRKRELAKEDGGPVIVLGDEAALPASKPRRAARQQLLPFATEAGYQMPSLNRLDTPRHSVVRFDEEA